MTRLLEEVAPAIQEVAAEVLEPAFARREELEAWEKSAGEVVTAAEARGLGPGADAEVTAEGRVRRGGGVDDVADGRAGQHGRSWLRCRG